MQLPEIAILCTVDVDGLYPNIAHEEGFLTSQKIPLFQNGKGWYTGKARWNNFEI